VVELEDFFFNIKYINKNQVFAQDEQRPIKKGLRSSWKIYVCIGRADRLMHKECHALEMSWLLDASCMHIAKKSIEMSDI
jgi:hypothetical protein